MCYVVQPWGRDKYHEATILSKHRTAEDAYDELSRLVEEISHYRAPDDPFEAYVVDEQRQPVRRAARD